MNSEVIQALRDSLVGDNLTLQQTNSKLAEMSKNEGYCMCLMEIINQPTFDIPLKQAALIQLKNNIKAKWKPKNQTFQLSANQKNMIRDNIVHAIVLCAKNYMLIKLYRQILTIIVGFQFMTWLPVNEIGQYIQKNQGLAPIFHCIIGICTNFQFSVAEKERIIYYQFLKVILPAVLITVKNNISNTQLIYLAMKILWKSVHYQISNQIKILTNDWMELVYIVIDSTNDQLQKHLSQHQMKNTPQFYYFHSKKWATRVLMRFVQKHAKAHMFGKIQQQNYDYSNYWYQNYGVKFCEVIIKHLQQPIATTKKIRYFQLKIIFGIVQDRPQLITSYADKFQYEILLKYMKITQQDENLAKEDVVQFLRNDDDMSTTFSNIKRVATQVWNAFMQIGGRMDRQANIYNPGPRFQTNLQFIYSKISSQDLVDRELGMFLFCQNRININRMPAYKQNMMVVLQKHVVPELSSPYILMRAKANDMFYQYGKQITNLTLLQGAIAGIYKCLTEDQSPLVRIKAALALNPIVTHQKVKEYLRPYLKNILQVYLKLIDQYDLQQVVSALEYFIDGFAQSIGPFAVDLFRYLSNIFVRMFNKDIQLSQNQQYGSQLELAASGCLKTLTQILQAPLTPQVRTQIQPCVLDLCAFMFANQSYDYIQQLMYLMRVHIQMVDKIQPPCWFFFQIIIYFITGIPNQLYTQIQNMAQLTQSHKQMLASVKGGDNLQFLEHVVPVIRNYMGKGLAMIMAQKQQFKTNVSHMIFYLIGYIYRKGTSKKQQLQGQIHFDCGSILIVYYNQTFPPQMTKACLTSTWNIIKYNLSKAKSRYLKQITVQLMGVALWKHTHAFLQIIAQDKLWKIVCNHILTIGAHLDQSQQRKRLILGICQLLHAAQANPAFFGDDIPNLFKLLIRLMFKNCRIRIIMNTNDSEQKKKLIKDGDSDQNISDEDDEDEDDEDMWDQQYSSRHASVLRMTNQIMHFNKTMQKLQTDNVQFYTALLQTVPNDKLMRLQVLIQASVNLGQK